MTALPAFSVEAFDQLNDLTASLGNDYRELAELVNAKRQGRVEAIRASLGSAGSTSAREQEADIFTVELACDIEVLRGEIRAKEVEREFLLAWMTASTALSSTITTED